MNLAAKAWFLMITAFLYQGTTYTFNFYSLLEKLGKNGKWEIVNFRLLSTNVFCLSSRKASLA